MSSHPPAFFVCLFLKKECSLSRREWDPSTPHSCTTAPSTQHSRGSASTVAYHENSPASPPWPTHPGREAHPDRKKQGTHRLDAAEHQLLQLVVHAAAVAVRQPSGGLPLSALRGVAVVEPPWRRPTSASLSRSPAGCCLRIVLSRSLSFPTPPADCRRAALLRRHSVLFVLALGFSPRPRSSLRSPKNV